MEAVDFAAVQRIILWGQRQRIMLHKGKQVVPYRGENTPQNCPPFFMISLIK